MMRASLVLALILPLTTASAVGREDQAVAEARLKRSCSADYVRLCHDQDPKGPAVVACFRRNAGSLLPKCRAAIATYRARKAGKVRP